MKDRIILHIDINYFFAQVEEVLNPSLKDKPVAVCSNQYRGIVSAANYNARKFGVSAAQKIYDAQKLCSELVVVKNNMFRYQQYSKKFFECIRNNFTSLIEHYSIDECYIDATDLIKKYHNNIFLLVNTIYKTILKETNLKTSIGIGENKFLAKTANDISDKKIFFNTLFKNEIQDKLYDQNINKIFFVGKKTGEIFNSLSINTVKDFIYYKDKQELIDILKSKYYILNNFFSGNSESALDLNNDENKSLSIAETFLYTTNENNFIKNKIIELSNQLYQKMRMQDLVAKTYVLALRDEFKRTTSRNLTIDKKIIDRDEFCNMFIKIYNKNWDNELINQISVGVSKLEKSNKQIRFKQLCIFDDY